MQEALAKIDYSDQLAALAVLKPYIHSFIPFVMTMFNACKPEPKFTAIMNNLPEQIININGIRMDRENFKWLIRFMYDTPRSKLYPSKTTIGSNPLYGSMTPLFMLAMKETHNFMYNDWDRDDPNLKDALGKFLSPLLETQPEPTLQSFSAENIKELRENYCKSKIDAYSCYWPGVKAPFQYMILQTWICHVSKREPGAMILHPTDWDYVPEPWDITLDDKEVFTPAIEQVRELAY